MISGSEGVREGGEAGAPQAESPHKVEGGIACTHAHILARRGTFLPGGRHHPIACCSTPTWLRGPCSLPAPTALEAGLALAQQAGDAGRVSSTLRLLAVVLGHPSQAAAQVCGSRGNALWSTRARWLTNRPQSRTALPLPGDPRATSICLALHPCSLCSGWGRPSLPRPRTSWLPPPPPLAAPSPTAPQLPQQAAGSITAPATVAAWPQCAPPAWESCLRWPPAAAAWPAGRGALGALPAQ